MSDDLIKRMAAAFLDKVPSPCRTYGLSNAMRPAMTAALSSLRPGDELPGGMVVMQGGSRLRRCPSVKLSSSVHGLASDSSGKSQERKCGSAAPPPPTGCPVPLPRKETSDG